MAIDVHCHWTPRGLASAAKAGREWYGWHLFRNEKGHEFVVHGHEALPFSASRSVLDDPAGRAAMRKDKEGIDLQNLVLTATFFSLRSTISFVALRARFAISRSRLRTPASRV